jgi:hypothetical protein
MEVRLCESGDEWTCDVSLRRQQDVNGEESIIPFWHTKREDEVEQILYRAQLAILNPDENVDEFRKKELAYTTSKLEFSEDTIIVEIFGASMNFTFIDLPGIINIETPVVSFREFSNSIGGTDSSELQSLCRKACHQILGR